MSRMEMKKNRKRSSRMKTGLFVFIILTFLVAIMTTDYVLRTMLALDGEKRVFSYMRSANSHVVQFMGSEIIIEQNLFLEKLNDMILWVLELLESAFTKISDIFLATQ
ncbi:MAG: hypothetical protein ACLKAK_05220 [Alkaliphilus sp.]